MTEQNEIVAGIQEHLNSKMGEMVLFLKKLVFMESPSKDIKKQHAVLDFLKKVFETMDYHAVHVLGKNTGGYLYARPKDRIKNIPLQLIIGHCDTVWPVDTIKEMPIAQKGSKLTGPGIYDMKAGLTQIIFALQAIKEKCLSLPITPIILINSDEEVGSRESTGIITKLAKISNRAYVMEPPLGLMGKLKTARKGLGRFTITVKGKAAHAGLDPGKGTNAIVELSHQVQKLYGMNDFDKGITVNVGMIEGGISPNMVAPISRAVIDVRVLKDIDGAYITKKIKALKPHLPGIELQVEGGIGRPAMEKTARNQELWEVARQYGQYLGIELEDAVAGGGSDANTTSLYTATLDGLGTPGDGAHAPHEYILHNSLVERTTLLILLLLAAPLKLKP